ncbi:hypothetical protein AC1031_004133 [Aphanomyces cochlioides]|nr:hypothetical protein AC1031_004133 [Aphanomyces cochlioides]
MRVGVWLLIALATLAQVQGQHKSKKHKVKKEIVGGLRAKVGKHRYVAGLKASANHETECGSTLIAPTLLLTAAHCVSDDIKVAAIGTHYNTVYKGGELIQVVQQIRHPKFNGDPLNGYDVAIMRLARASTITPGKLLFDPVPAGTPLTVRGWGLTTDGGQASNELLEVQVNVHRNKQCMKSFNIPSWAQNSFCAGGVKGKDACQGDSGGPIVFEQGRDEFVVGVVSFGDGCGKAKPGVYARLSHPELRDFILPYLNS